MNLMIVPDVNVFLHYIPGQTFLRFDFSKHPYAYGRERVPNEREREK